MLRRTVLQLTSRRQSTRVPSLLSSRKEFSVSLQKHASQKAGPNVEPPDPKRFNKRLLLGSLFVGAAITAAYEWGYRDKFIRKEKQSHVSSDEAGIEQKDMKGEQQVSPISDGADKISHFIEEAAQKVQNQTDLPHVETEQKVETLVDAPHVETEQKVKTQTELPLHEASSKTQSENLSVVEDGTISIDKNPKPQVSQSTDSEGSSGIESTDSKTTQEPNERIQVAPVQVQATVVPMETEMKTVSTQHLAAEGISEAAPGEDASSLLSAYHLKEKAENGTVPEGLVEKAIVSAVEELNDGYITNDGKLVMDFLQAIHAAEKRQAELDAIAFAEEKKALKEKYEKELRDLRARELMHAEEAAILDKEIKRERAKAAAAINAVQEKMEEKLRVELEQKQNESELKLQKLQELAKAQLSAAIASEKAAQIERMAEANLNINALCMAFYARSEEARQIHSVHKLALGALALEDALSKGLPIQQELDAINTYLEGIDKSSLLHLVLSTLPDDTRHNGTDTIMELNQKFNDLKGSLRHHILIPPGGGGILVHALSEIASWLRFKGVDPSGDGIESVITRVENLLAKGKLAEAADALQEGVRGSQAEELAGDWVRRVRNRAITEQALTALQSYTTCIGLAQ